MRIGCPKEIKAQEGRVGLTPASQAAFGVTASVYHDSSALSMEIFNKFMKFGNILLIFWELAGIL